MIGQDTMINQQISKKHNLQHNIAGNGVVVVFLVLLISAIIYGIYIYYVTLQTRTQLDLKLRAINDQYTQQLNSNAINSATISELKQSLINIESRIDKLSIIGGTNKSRLILPQLVELIYMANQSLLVYHNIKLATSLLLLAQNILSDSNDPEFIKLKQAIAQNLEQLSQVAVIDNISLVGRLDAFMIQAQNLPLQQSLASLSQKNDSTGDKFQLPVTQNGNNLVNIWQKFWNNLKADIAILIKITTPSKINSVEQSNRIKLLPADEILVRQNISLYLLNAKVALLQQNQNSWQINLISAARCFRDYFFIDETLTNVIASLNDLATVKITYDSINLNDTVQALNTIVNLIKVTTNHDE